MKRLKDRENRLKGYLKNLKDEIGEVYFFDSLPSTMDAAFNLEENLISDRTLIITDVQSQGRGRSGKGWYSSRDSLVFSIILINQDFQIPHSMIGAYAVFKTLKAYNERVRLKWINDVLWENGKKIAGVLTEERGIRTVIGIGINLNDKKIPENLKDTATSYFIETGEEIPKDEFLLKIVEELLSLLKRVERGAIERVLSEWEVESGIRNRRVVVMCSNGNYYGTVIGIDKTTGALRLLSNDRELEIYEGSLAFC